MKDSRLSNTKPKCTILESFDGMIIVIGPILLRQTIRKWEGLLIRSTAPNPDF